MGSTFFNIQVRANNQGDVAQVIETIDPGPCYVSPPLGGWVTIYDEQSYDGDPREADRLARELSARLGVAAFHFAVYDSDALFYSLFECGKLLDRYAITPGDDEESDDVDPDDGGFDQGRPEVLVRLCRPGTSLDDVRGVLGPDVRPGNAFRTLMSGFVGGGSSSAESRLARLAHLLGLDEDRVRLGFPDFRQHLESSEVILGDYQDFLAVCGA